MPDTIIRRMTLQDLDRVYDIECSTFPRPWSLASFEKELRENKAARYLVAECDGRVVGYAGAWLVLDESQVTNIAVDADYRGQGIGRQLTEGLLQYISNLGAAYVTLQVRVSNTVAQNLYKSLGFISVGKRKRYYEDNGEDAYLMVLDHMPPVDPEFTEEDTVYE